MPRKMIKPTLNVACSPSETTTPTNRPLIRRQTGGCIAKNSCFIQCLFVGIVHFFRTKVTKGTKAFVSFYTFCNFCSELKLFSKNHQWFYNIFFACRSHSNKILSTAPTFLQRKHIRFVTNIL